MEPTRLFVVGNHEIKSREGTTQGDPTAMGAYALGVTPLIHFLSKFIFINEHRSKEVAFADDFTVAGKASEIKAYWDILQQRRPWFGYFPKPCKSYMIVSEQQYNKGVDVFMGSKVKVTSEGKRSLVVIGSEAFKVSYPKSLVDDWIKQLKLLSIIVKSEPQSAYSAFVGGSKGKRVYFMRTIPSLRELFKPLQDVIRFNVIPAIIGVHLYSDNDRILLMVD